MWSCAFAFTMFMNKAVAESGRWGTPIAFPPALAKEFEVFVALECHLGRALLQQRKFKDARSVLDRALAKQVAALGAHHPSALSTKSRLADAYRGAGEWSNAKRAYSEVLTGLSPLLGERHAACVEIKSKIQEIQWAERSTRSASQAAALEPTQARRGNLQWLNVKLRQDVKMQ